MPKKKKTRPGTKKAKIEKEYQKERKRLNQLARRLEKRGYIVDRSKIIPEKPKRLTEKSVERLRKIKPENVYKKIQFVDPDTGEIVPGSKGREIEKQRRKKPQAPTEPTQEIQETQQTAPEPEPEPELPEEWEIGLDNLNELLNSIDIAMDDPECKNPNDLLYIRGLIQDQIDQYGPKKYWDMIKNDVPKINDAISKLTFESKQTKIEFAFNLLIEALRPGGQMTVDVNADINDIWDQYGGGGW